MVPKKDSKEKRYIINYHPLNTVTRKDITPLPNLAQCIKDLQGLEIFSKFNICWGYNNIRICEGDKWKGTFKTQRGLFEPKVMFFGMSNSLASFQHFVNNKIMEAVYRKFGAKGQQCLKNYMDDFGLRMMLADIDFHIKIINFLFDLLAEHSLHLKLSKSIFMQPQMDFLGVQISKHSATINPAKIAGIAEYPCNILNLRQARGFLGVTSYHRMFVKNFSIIAAPITQLTGKDVPFKWGPEQQAAQEEIIHLITHPPVLVKPDLSRQFKLEVNASQIEMGAILYQCDPPTKQADGTDKLGPR